MKVASILIADLESDISALKDTIKVHAETINSGIFTTAKEKLKAKVRLSELNDQLRTAEYVLSRLKMPL